MNLLTYRAHSSPSFLLHNSATVWCTHSSEVWNIKFLATTDQRTSLMCPTPKHGFAAPPPEVRPLRRRHSGLTTMTRRLGSSEVAFCSNVQSSATQVPANRDQFENKLFPHRERTYLWIHISFWAVNCAVSYMAQINNLASVFALKFRSDLTSLGHRSATGKARNVVKEMKPLYRPRRR
jgi:hypothetical protein